MPIPSQNKKIWHPENQNLRHDESVISGPCTSAKEFNLVQGGSLSYSCAHNNLEQQEEGTSNFHLFTCGCAPGICLAPYPRPYHWTITLLISCNWVLCSLAYLRVIFPTCYGHLSTCRLQDHPQATFPYRGKSHYQIIRWPIKDWIFLLFCYPHFVLALLILLEKVNYR